MKAALHEKKLNLIVQVSNKMSKRERRSDSQAINRITILNVSVEQSQKVTAGYFPPRNSDFNSNKQTSTNVWEEML